MTTLTLDDKINLSKTHFSNVNELLEFLISTVDFNVEFEDFTIKEVKKINSLKWAKEFKNQLENKFWKM